jgi:hypothetical protein
VSIVMRDRGEDWTLDLNNLKVGAMFAKRAWLSVPVMEVLLNWGDWTCRRSDAVRGFAARCRLSSLAWLKRDLDFSFAEGIESGGSAMNGIMMSNVAIPTKHFNQTFLRRRYELRNISKKDANSCAALNLYRTPLLLSQASSYGQKSGLTTALT